MANNASQLLNDIRSDNPKVRSAAARNPNATPEILMIAINDEDEYVRWAAAFNRNATPEVLFQLALEGGVGSVHARNRINSDPILALQYAAYKAPNRRKQVENGKDYIPSS